MTAVDVDALDKLREEVAAWLFDFSMRRAATTVRWSDGLTVTDDDGNPLLREATVRAAWRSEADALIAGPLVPLLAEVRRGRALREAVEGLAEDMQEVVDAGDASGSYYESAAANLRAALAAVDSGEQP